MRFSSFQAVPETLKIVTNSRGLGHKVSNIVVGACSVPQTVITIGFGFCGVGQVMIAIMLKVCSLPPVVMMITSGAYHAAYEVLTIIIRADTTPQRLIDVIKYHCSILPAVLSIMIVDSISS